MSLPRKPARDNLIVHALLFVSIVLIVGYACAWWYRQQQETLRSQVAYSPPVEVTIATQDYSMAATLAIKTSAADAAWGQETRRTLEQLVRERMNDTDPARLLAPNGLKAWQESLRDESNARLKTDKVQEILITDFVFSAL